MWKFLKTMVAEDVTTTEEVLVAEVLEEEVPEALEAKEVRHQEKGVLADLEAQLREKADLEATEIQPQEKVVFQEAQHLDVKADLHQDHRMHQEERVVLQQDLPMRHEKEALLVEHQDALKVLVMPQDQEDQEKNNNIC